VLIFELVYGEAPFWEPERLVMFRRICSGQYTCPKFFSPVSPKPYCPSG
jgi:hypothetical protein